MKYIHLDYKTCCAMKDELNPVKELCGKVIDIEKHHRDIHGDYAINTVTLKSEPYREEDCVYVPECYLVVYFNCLTFFEGL